jgi:hypothetical protein
MILSVTCSVSLQQQDGPEPTNDDGSPFEFFPPAPVVLFCKNSPPLKKVVMQNQPISPKSASKSKATSELAASVVMPNQPISPKSASQSKAPSELAASRVPTKTRTAVRKVVARKTLKRRSPSPESSHVR